MKTKMLTFMLVIATLFMDAQSSEHLTFKGIPIDGSLAGFVQKLQHDGFKTLGNADGVVFLEGEFAAYKGCVVGVQSLEQFDLVSSIWVRFPERDTWSSLSGDYIHLKGLLTEKYGTPAEEIEEFVEDIPLYGDLLMMHAVRMNSCECMTTYEVENGLIQLAIESDSDEKCFVSLYYLDKKNSERVRQKALDDL